MDGKLLWVFPCEQSILILASLNRGVGILAFMGFVGRLLGISVAGSIFANQLRHNLSVYVPDLPPQVAAALLGSASAIWDDVPDVSASPPPGVF